MEESDHPKREGSDVQDPVEAGARNYSHFIAERERIVEARQRVQQRTDHLITSGAAGALALSITFIDAVAPEPVLSSRVFLLAAWGLLLSSLLSSLAASFASQHAFDDVIEAYDRAFLEDVPYSPSPVARAAASWLSLSGAATFVLGVASFAWFGFLNILFVE